MNKNLLIIVMCLISKSIFSQVSFWQNSNFGLPDIHEPVILLSPYDYKNFQSKYLTKTTGNFNLSGKVKSIKETFSSNNNQEIIIQYRFLENKKLTLFQIGDTLQSLSHSRAKINTFSYTNGKLKKIEMFINFPSYHTYKTVHKFDEEGFLSQSIFNRINNQSSNDDKPDFDYTKHYLWNKNRDSVFLKCNYKIPEAHYQRERDRYICFTNKTENTPKSTMLSRIFTKKKVKYDKNGNIIKRIYIDNAIKSATNTDSKYLYKYDKNNELIKILYYERPHFYRKKSKWILVESYTIQYLNYDEKGNWTLKRVKTLFKKYNPIKYAPEFDYKREIVYFK